MQSANKLLHKKCINSVSHCAINLEFWLLFTSWWHSQSRTQIFHLSINKSKISVFGIRQIPPRHRLDRAMLVSLLLILSLLNVASWACNDDNGASDYERLLKRQDPVDNYYRSNLYYNDYRWMPPSSVYQQNSPSGKTFVIKIWNNFFKSFHF